MSSFVSYSRAGVLLVPGGPGNAMCVSNGNEKIRINVQGMVMQNSVEKVKQVNG